MRTILLSLLLAFQTAHTQQTQDFNPCKDAKLSFGSSLATFKASVAKYFEGSEYDINVSKDGDGVMLYLGGRTDGHPRMYVFMNDKYVAYVDYFDDGSDDATTKAFNKLDKRLKLGANSIADESTYVHACGDDELFVSPTLNLPLINVTVGSKKWISKAKKR